MKRDPLSAFLHSPTWRKHAHGEQDMAGNIFVRQAIPKGSYWVSSRCFIPSDWFLPDFTAGSWFVRMQPDSAESAANLKSTTGRYKHVRTLAIQPAQTLILDLSQSEETLLAQMKQKHRYNIRVAEKNGVETEIITHNLLDAFPRFWNLLTTTAERHTFRTHKEPYYRSILENLEPQGKALLAFARYQGHDIAAFLIVTEGSVATYLHGGSNYEQRNLMAPYLLHWTAIRHLKEQGLTTYDFWGIHVHDGEPLKDHASSGTTRFKLGFGGTIVEYPPAVDIVLKPLYYNLYKGIQRLRSRKRAFS